MSPFASFWGWPQLAPLVGLLDVIPDPAAIAAVSLVGTLAVLDLTWNPGEKAHLLTAASNNIASMEGEVRALWEDVNAERVSDLEAEKVLRSLRAIIRSATSNIAVGTDAKLNQRCTEEAYPVESARYAARQ